MVLICGASSLFTALTDKNKKYSSISKRLSKHTRSDKGVSLNPYSKNKKKTLQKIITQEKIKDSIIVWHDIINNTITDHPYDPRRPLTVPELLTEIRAIPQIVGIAYCHREGSPNIYQTLKTLEIPVVHLVTDLISNIKQADLELVQRYTKLHLDTELELKSVSIIRNNCSDLQKLLKKKKKQKPSQKQRRAARKRKANEAV